MSSLCCARSLFGAESVSIACCAWRAAPMSAHARAATSCGPRHADAQRRRAAATVTATIPDFSR